MAPRRESRFFFPGLIDSLERLIGYLRDRGRTERHLDARRHQDVAAAEDRQSLGAIPQTNAVTLEAIWLDLTLERIGYILFGEVSNVILSDITIETLPTAIDVIRSMILSVRAKGQGTWQLDESDAELAAIKQSGDLNFYTIYSAVERINAEIGAITDKTVETYYDVTKRVFALRQVPKAEEAASAFVDGLFRATTLQHLSELTLKLLNFSRKRMTELMKRVRHPTIREISYAKIIRIKRDMDGLVSRAEPFKFAYHFEQGAAEGRMAYYPILGEKGAYLAEMARLGVNVPPGFTLTSKVCNMFFSDGRVLCDKTQEALLRCLEKLEEITGCVLGSRDRPLLLAVRAGSCVSMPGMMDTILNVGFNRETAEGLGRLSGNPMFAYECYYRLILKYSASVFGFVPSKGDVIGERSLACSSPDEIRQVLERLLVTVGRATGKPFPEDPREQLMGALKAIFSSWQSESAIAYRQIFNIPHQFGTAATIQQMVFGNLGQQSCSGVAFSAIPLPASGTSSANTCHALKAKSSRVGRGNPCL